MGINFFFCVGPENDLVSVSGSKFTWLLCWFLCGDRNCIGFSAGIEIDFFFLRGGAKLTVCRAKLTWF